MEEKRIDARGLSCPQPVLLARAAILEAGAEAVCVVVDDEVSAENVQRMAQSQGWGVAAETVGRETRLHLRRGQPAAPVGPDSAPAPAAAQVRSPAAATVVLVASELLGTGDEKLGRLLMRAFLKTLKDTEPRPARIVFMNSGVRFSTVGSDVLDDLRALEIAGVELLSCGTCLDYYGLLDSLSVGRKSNMFEIASTLLVADRVVRP